MREKRDEITGLRGLTACFIAYIFHYTELFHTMPEINPVQTAVMGFLARYSVCMSEVFFMISGMLLYFSYHSRIAQGHISFRDFMIPKMKKIYPMMMVTAFVTWALQKIGYALYGCYILHPEGAQVRNSFKALLVSLLGLQTGWISDNDTLAVNGPSWFISVFFVCYGIYYGITYLVKKDWQRNLCYGFVVLLGLFLMIRPLGLPLLYCTSGRGYFSFFVGVLMAQAIAREDEQMRQRRCVQMTVVLVCTIVLAEALPEVRTLAYVSAFVWPALVYLVYNQKVLRRIMGWKPFVWLGNLCMPIFLWNMATDVAIELGNRLFKLELDYANIWIWMLHIILSLVVAWTADKIDQRTRKGFIHGKTI